MNRVSNASIIGVLVLIAGAVLFALRPGSSTIEVLPDVPLPDPQTDPAGAVVIGLHESGGFSLFGMDFGTVTHIVSVQFHAAPGCFDQANLEDPWPTPYEECASAVTIAGTISGNGIAPTGESIVAVDVEVSAACYDTVNRGDRWPPAAAECSS